MLSYDLCLGFLSGLCSSYFSPSTLHAFLDMRRSHSCTTGWGCLLLGRVAAKHEQPQFSIHISFVHCSPFPCLWPSWQVIGTDSVAKATIMTTFSHGWASDKCIRCSLLGTVANRKHAHKTVLTDNWFHYLSWTSGGNKCQCLPYTFIWILLLW
jgi:hypothetical protein